MKRFTFQTINRLKRLNRLVQILLCLTLVAAVNYLALKNYKRYDLQENNLYALTPETIAYLSELSAPIDIIVTVPANSPREEDQILFRYVSRLLKEYKYQSEQHAQRPISIQFVDIYKNLSTAESLARQYGLDEPNVVMVISNENVRILRPDELLDFEDRKPVAFTGEAALSSAILEVANKNTPVIYFVYGHGEMSPDDTGPNRGLSRVIGELKLRNFSIKTLDLNSTPTVPSDADLVILADPSGSLLPAEVEKLRAYLSDEAGRLMAWFSPGKNLGLDSLFFEWGIASPDQLILESDSDYVEASGNYIIRNFSDHPAVKSLIRNQTFVVSGLSRPVYPNVATTNDERLFVVPLMASSKASWAESAYRENPSPVFNPGVDFKGPVPLASAAEKKASSQLGIKVPGGKLIVFGSPDLFVNNRMSTIGNIRLFFNSLNWLIDRDQMLTIPPRPIQSYQLAMSQRQILDLGTLFLTIPASFGLLGFFVFLVRRF